MTSPTYAITFRGEAGKSVRSAFEDLDLSVDAGFTTLRGQFPDQAALHGVIDRTRAFGLELVNVQLLEVDEDA